MTTIISSSDKGRCLKLYRGMMRRNMAFMILLGIIGFLFGTLQYILHIYRANMRLDIIMNGLLGQSMLLTPASAVLFTGMMLVAPVIIGLSQLSYLHSKKSVDVYHSLPVTRPQLLLCNLAAAFTTVMVPAVINYLLMTLAGAFRGTTTLLRIHPLGILAELGTWAVIVLAILAAIAFVAVLVGSVFDTLLFSMELLVLPLMVALACVALFEAFLLGFSTSDMNIYHYLVLSPFSVLISRLTFDWRWVYEAGGPGGRTIDWSMAPQQMADMRLTAIAVVVWLVIAVALVAAACLLYSRRKSETAESSSSSGILAQISKLATVFLGGTLGSMLLCSIMGANSVWVYVLWTAICGAVVYTITEAVLLRGFRGFRRGLPAAAVLLALTTLFSAMLVTGGLGFEKRIPAPDTVQGVTVTYRGRYNTALELDASSKRVGVYSESALQEASDRGELLNRYEYHTLNTVTLTSDEALAIIREIHQGLAASGWKTFGPNRRSDDRIYMNFRVGYELKNGGSFNRSYNEFSPEQSALLARLEGTQEFKTKTNPIFRADAKNYTAVAFTGGLGGPGKEVMDEASMAKLIEALKADCLDEDLSKVMDGSAKDLGFVSFTPRGDVWDQDLSENVFASCDILITEDFTRTIAVLRELGMADGLGTVPDELAQVLVMDHSFSYRGNDGAIYVLADPSDSGTLLSYMDKYAGVDLADIEGYPDKEGYQLVSDPQLMRQLIQAGRLQLPVVKPSVTIVLLDKDDLPIGLRAVTLDQLPKEIYDKLSAHTRERGMESTTTTESRAVIGGADGPTAVLVNQAAD